NGLGDSDGDRQLLSLLAPIELFFVVPFLLLNLNRPLADIRRAKQVSFSYQVAIMPADFGKAWSAPRKLVDERTMRNRHWTIQQDPKFGKFLEIYGLSPVGASEQQRKVDVYHHGQTIASDATLYSYYEAFTVPDVLVEPKLRFTDIGTVT